MITMFGRIKHKEIVIVTSVVMFLLIIVLLIASNIYERYILKNVKTENITEYTYEETLINEEMIVISYSILRDGPNESNSKIHAYNKGDKIQVISKLSNGWYKIDAVNQTGFIKSKNIRSTSEVFIDKDGNVIYSVEQDGTIVVDGNVSNSLINYAYNYLYMIPENVRNDFKKQGWKIVLTDKSLSKELDISYEISGATVPKDKTILIYGSQSCIRYALVHEIGHYIDFRSNFISKTDSFRKLYIKHGDEMLEYNENYAKASFSEEEYFAELYRAAILGDYNIRFRFSEDIDFVLNIANNIETIDSVNAA